MMHDEKYWPHSRTMNFYLKAIIATCRGQMKERKILGIESSFFISSCHENLSLNEFTPPNGSSKLNQVLTIINYMIILKRIE